MATITFITTLFCGHTVHHLVVKTVNCTNQGLLIYIFTFLFLNVIHGRAVWLILMRLRGNVSGNESLLQFILEEANICVYIRVFTAVLCVTDNRRCPYIKLPSYITYRSVLNKIIKSGCYLHIKRFVIYWYCWKTILWVSNLTLVNNRTLI